MTETALVAHKDTFLDTIWARLLAALIAIGGIALFVATNQATLSGSGTEMAGAGNGSYRQCLDERMVAVLQTSDTFLLSITRSALDNEGIPCVVQGQEAQGLIPVEAVVLVTPDHEEEARAVIDHDEVLNELSLEIEEHCWQILALQQPVAGEFRAMVTALRINAANSRGLVARSWVRVSILALAM